MLTIQRFSCNMLSENCYIVSDETRQCVIIDCGAFYEEEHEAIANYIAGNQLTPVKLLATHGHADHHFGNGALYRLYGLRPEVAAEDEPLMKTIQEQASQMFMISADLHVPPVGRLLEGDGEAIPFGNHQLTVIETPGHSPGSVAYYCREEGVVFTGDTLFRGSIGRTDLPGGSMMQIIQSLRRLAQLPDETTVYPGHGEETTIGNEVAHNPYMDR